MHVDAIRRCRLQVFGDSSVIISLPTSGLDDCTIPSYQKCVDEWLKMKATCPVCRNSLPDRENKKLDQL
ncbi:hypothetical protein HAX54_013161 [Datura stramonium]|uniref:RING-type domain-containing protein n=1 Tax=Datura stramonium TaxID=4076 RepID=A0ABS8TMN4_DATST|nr:hypothetical protein [Datura stramonium]